VFVVAFVGSWNDYKKEEQFLKLQAISEKDNIVRQLSIIQLAIGDGAKKGGGREDPLQFYSGRRDNENKSRDEHTSGWHCTKRLRHSNK
jgi:hypothetical protein